MILNVLLFDNYTALDAFGPVEVLSKVPDCRIRYWSLEGGTVVNKQEMRVETEPVSVLLEASADGRYEGTESEAESEAGRTADDFTVLLVPGGPGSRQLVNDKDFLCSLGDAMDASDYVLTVCTGAALAAAAGRLDGVRATSNKMAFDWVMSCGPDVIWERDPRWVADGKYYTSAGISAGIDMAFAFVRDKFGEKLAEKVSRILEYRYMSN